MHLPIGLPLVPGDRFILRESGQGVTLGGGEILDVDPVVPASQANPIATSSGWSVNGAAPTSTTCADSPANSERPTSAGGRSIPPPWAPRVDELRRPWRTRGSRTRDCSLDEFERAVLEALDDITIDGALARAAGSTDVLADSDLVARLEADPFAPPGSTTPTRPRSRTRPPRRACSRKVVWSSQRAPSTRRPGSWLGCWPTNPTESPSPRPAMRGAPRASSRSR